MRHVVGPAAGTGGGSFDFGDSAVATTESGPTRQLIWRLQSGGWTQAEAGNLAAIALGLRPARTGWTGPQLDHLRFLKTLVITGRIEH